MRLTVALPGREYPIVISQDALARAPEFLSGGVNAVVTDENVYRLHGARLEAILRESGVKFHTVIVPPGEKSKSMDRLNFLYGEFCNAGLTRKDRVAAFGGGVVGDLAGFAAATYMRGVPFVQLPTTLLAQVDASVGGKVAVNLDMGKNLAGSFCQPRAVLADTGLLSTLPEREWLTGMAEVVKHAAIGGGRLAELLTATTAPVPPETLDELICLNCEYKASVVMRDELDTSARMVLNFGHTFGHALEALHGYEKYTHGEAVAVGMALAARAGTLLGVSEPGTEAAVLRLMDDHGLAHRLEDELSDVIRLMSGDKKNEGGGLLTLILLEKIGRPGIYQITPERLSEIFTRGNFTQGACGDER